MERIQKLGRMKRGQITSLQEDLRNADRVEMIPMATAEYLDPRSEGPCGDQCAEILLQVSYKKRTNEG